MSLAMKPNRLPPTDVANYASLAAAEMLKALTGFRATGAPSVSYAGVRSCHGDCFGLRAGELVLRRLDRTAIERQVERESAPSEPRRILRPICRSHAAFTRSQ